MFVLKIDKNIKLLDLEEQYRILHSYCKKGIVVDLMLPRELKYDDFGIVPALYQFAITWAHYERAGKLILDIEAEIKEDIEKLYENELIFPIVALVWNKLEIFNRSGKVNLRSALINKNNTIFKKMRDVSAMKGWKLLLTNIDHFPEDKGILPCFENNGLFLTNESRLRDNLKTGIEEVLNYSSPRSEAGQNYTEVEKHLIAIIYELMKNTHEWAREDEDNVPIDPSIRGLLIKFYKKSRNRFIEEYKNHKGLREYLQSSTLKENTKKELLFLEIDVFDSGDGFAKKYRSVNMNSNYSEIQILKKCLILHNTLASGLEKDDKGLGLDRILSILDKKGFFKIKTGSLDVYRNMIANPYKNIDKENIKEMELYDWKKGSNQTYTEFHQVKGTVITIIYPLLFNS